MSAEVVVSAVIGTGVISALVSYKLTMREFHKKTDVEFIKDKMLLYAKLIQELNSLKYQNDVLAPASKDELFYSDFRWSEIEKKIDGIIDEYPLLLTPAIHEKWVRAKTIPGADDSLVALKEMRNMLIEEYNGIHDKHLKRISDIIPRIPTDKPSSTQ